MAAGKQAKPKNWITEAIKGCFRKEHPFSHLPAAFTALHPEKQERRFFHARCYALDGKGALRQAAFRVRFWQGQGVDTFSLENGVLLRNNSLKPAPMKPGRGGH